MPKDIRPAPAGQLRIPRPGRNGSHKTPPPFTDDEAARVVLEVSRTGLDPDEATRKRLTGDWPEAALFAVDGPDGLDNWLRAIRNRLRKSPVRFVELEAALGRARSDSPDPDPPEPPKPFRFQIMDAAELARTEFRMEWLVKRILVADQPCVVGAAKKGLKTTTMLDLAISLASGSPFLGKFEIPTPVSTWLLSGESGGFAIKETAKRICDSKGFALESLAGRFHVGFELPKLSIDEHLEALGEGIRENGIRVVMVDPFYLCLLSGSATGKQVDPSNLFHVGPLLLHFAQTCLDAGATPILVHHNRISGQEPFSVPELGNLAFAGIQEFARQWILLGRRKRYEPGTGLHELWLTVGGSAGHSGEWAFDVNEGVMDDDFQGRKWEVEVKSTSDARNEMKSAVQSERKAKENAKEVEKLADFRRHEDQILEALRKNGGSGTRTGIRDLTPLNTNQANAAIARLIADGRIVEDDVAFHRGKKTVKKWGIRLP